MNEIQKIARELSRDISGQMDAHLFESIVSLFNRGVLVHYVRSPKQNIDLNNLNMTIEAASGVRFEGRERMIELQTKLSETQKRLEEAERVVDFYRDESNWESYGDYEYRLFCVLEDGFKEAKEYQEKYKTAEGAK